MGKSISPIIALITDFGTRDWYVGSIKGHILQQHPTATIVDVTHDIESGNIWDASYVLSVAVKDFPAHTIFMIVVDPGVGTSREAIIGRIGDMTVICPNNGILSHCLHYYPEKHGPFYELLPEHGDKDIISATFHGRDIFAPVAGKVAAGTLKPVGMGTVIHNLVRLQIAKAEVKRGFISGNIQYIDHFGNAITNISQAELGLFTMKPTASLEVKQLLIPLRNTFGEVEEAEPLAYIGSNGFLEIAINQRNAAKSLGLKVGDPVCFHLKD